MLLWITPEQLAGAGLLKWKTGLKPETLWPSVPYLNDGFLSITDRPAFKRPSVLYHGFLHCFSFLANLIPYCMIFITISYISKTFVCAYNLLMHALPIP